MTENEMFEQRFDAMEKKLDKVLDSQETYRKESRDDRERIIRLDQKVEDMKEWFVSHKVCHEEECTKNHKAVRQAVENRFLIALIPIVLSILFLFATKWMNSLENSAQAKQQQQGVSK